MEKRYVHNTFVTRKTEHQENFLYYINNIIDSIKFTVEESKRDGSMPFLDPLIKQ